MIRNVASGSARNLVSAAPAVSNTSAIVLPVVFSYSAAMAVSGDFATAAALTSDSGTWVVPYRIAGADFKAQADAQIRVHDAETGGSSGEPVDVVLLPDKSRVERGVDPDRRWHLEGPSTGGGDSGSLFGPLGGDFAAGARSRVPFGDRFVLYQRNIENLCTDKAALSEEIRKSVAELFDAAFESHAAIAIKGAPEQHAEGANIPGDEDR